MSRAAAKLQNLCSWFCAILVQSRKKHISFEDSEKFKREMKAELCSVKDGLKFCSEHCDETKVIKVISTEIKVVIKDVSDLISCS